MGRFSPTVREEAFDLGGVLDRLQAGYLGGRQRKQDRRRLARQEGLEDEDRNLYRRSLRAADLGQPGSRTLATQLSDPQSTSLTSASLRAMGDANVETVRPEFERPEPYEVQMLGGKTMMMQERAPYEMASGIIMDQSAARREQNLGTVLAAQTKRGITGPEPTPEDKAKEAELLAAAKLRGGRRTPGMLAEDVAYERDIKAAGRTPGGEGPPKSVALIEKQIDATRDDLNFNYSTNPLPQPGRGGAIDPVQQAAYNEGERRQQDLQVRMDSLTTERDRMVRDFQVQEGVVPKVLRGPSEIERGPSGIEPPRVLSSEGTDLFTGIQRAVAGAGPPRGVGPPRAAAQTPGATPATPTAQLPGASPPAAPAPVTPTGPEEIPRAATPGESPPDDILIKLLERFGEDVDGMIAELKRLGYSTTD